MSVFLTEFEKWEYDISDFQLAVPAAALVEGEDFLQKVGEFRSKQRIPVSNRIHV